MPTVSTVRQTTAVPHSVSVEIDGIDVSVYSAVERVDISLRQNEHDLVTIIMAGIPAVAVTDYVDRPVLVRLTVPYGEGFTFTGFINHIEPTHKARDGRVDGGLLQEAKLICLGASSAMRGVKARMWKDFTIKDMVEEMSVDYKFSYSCPDTAPTIPSMSQRGLSDWEALTKACVQSGLAVNVHGTEIHVWNPLTALQHGAPSGVLQSVGSAGGIESAPGRIMEFSGKFGSAHAYGDVNFEKMSILDEHGKLLTAERTDLLGDEPVAGTAVTSTLTDVLPIEAVSFSDARRKMTATRAYSSAYIAKVVTIGVAGPMPGSPIAIDGFNGEFDGLWLVRGVEMKTNRGHFLTEWDLSRSTKGRDIRQSTSLDTYQPAPHPKLESGAWRSSTRRANVYSSV